MRPAALPAAPEDCRDPKAAVVEAARRSHSRAIKTGLPPRPASSMKHGPDYADVLADFARAVWSPADAEHRSDSLRRARGRLAELAARLHR